MFEPFHHTFINVKYVLHLPPRRLSVLLLLWMSFFTCPQDVSQYYVYCRCPSSLAPKMSLSTTSIVDVLLHLPQDVSQYYVYCRCPSSLAPKTSLSTTPIVDVLLHLP